MNIFDVSCKVWSTRHRNTIEEVCWRLLFKDLIRITEFSMQPFFSRDSNPWQRYSLEVPLITPVIASGEIYWIFSKFWWNELLYAFLYMISYMMSYMIYLYRMLPINIFIQRKSTKGVLVKIALKIYNFIKTILRCGCFPLNSKL